MQKNRFIGKTAIVTGAGQGIGYEMAKQLLSEGATVILNDVNERLANQAAETLSSFGTCLAFPGDVSSSSFNYELVDFAVSKTGSLDVVLANAGITLFGDFLTYQPDHLNQVMQVNMGGSFFLAQAAANCFITQKKRGSILFTSSITGHQAHKDLAAYGMTKAALELLAKHLTIELGPFGITVNTVAPGATLTERTLSDPAYQDAWAKITPIGSAAKTQDIAQAALFLVSDEAKHITGQTLIVDGGWTCVSPSPF